MEKYISKITGKSEKQKELMAGFKKFLAAYTGTFDNIFAYSEEELVKLNIDFGKWYQLSNDVHFKELPTRPAKTKKDDEPDFVPALLSEKEVGGFTAFGLFLIDGSSP